MQVTMLRRKKAANHMSASFPLEVSISYKHRVIFLTGRGLGSISTWQRLEYVILYMHKNVNGQCTIVCYHSNKFRVN
jgi:hypothetical protein